MIKKKLSPIKALRIILFNQITIMTALYFVPGMPDKERRQLISVSEATADLLEDTR